MEFFYRASDLPLFLIWSLGLIVLMHDFIMPISYNLSNRIVFHCNIFISSVVNNFTILSLKYLCVEIIDVKYVE